MLAANDIGSPIEIDYSTEATVFGLVKRKEDGNIALPAEKSVDPSDAARVGDLPHLYQHWARFTETTDSFTIEFDLIMYDTSATFAASQLNNARVFCMPRRLTIGSGSAPTHRVAYAYIIERVMTIGYYSGTGAEITELTVSRITSGALKAITNIQIF